MRNWVLDVIMIITFETFNLNFYLDFDFGWQNLGSSRFGEIFCNGK